MAKKRVLSGDAIKVKKHGFGYHPGRMAGLVAKAKHAKRMPVK